MEPELRTSLNLLTKYSKNLAPKYGFYILCRVRHHVTFTEAYDDGWGAATEALQDLWFRFEVVDLDEREKAA